MGCDIHMYTEVKDREGKWAKVGKVFKDDYPKKDTPTDEIYTGRSYGLFSVLADVRNDEKSEITPIAHPKGLPSDVSEEVRAIVDWWGCDAHSRSFFTLKELLDYDWKEQKITMLREMDVETYRKFRDGGEPYPCCRSISGPSIIKVTPEQMDLIDSSNTIIVPGKEYYVQVEFEESCYDRCKYFVETCIPLLQALGDPEDVRIVFFFDN